MLVGLSSTMRKWVSSPFSHFYLPCFLEEFELLGGFRSVYHYPAAEYFHHPKLFIGDADDPDMAFWRQDRLHSSHMHIGIFPAAAVAYIHAELEHRKPVCHDLLAEQGIVFPVLFGISRQIKMH
jgi:hypothetical protein